MMKQEKEPIIKQWEIMQDFDRKQVVLSYANVVVIQEDPEHVLFRTLKRKNNIYKGNENTDLNEMISDEKAKKDPLIEKSSN